jgi:small-conductance mechanosensitive channel
VATYRGPASQSFFEWAPIADWLSRAREFFSPALLRALALQLGVIGFVFAITWLLRSWTRAAVDRIAGRFLQSEWIRSELQTIAALICAWLLLVAVDLMADNLGVELRLVGVAATLTALGIVLRASTLLFHDALLARIVAAAAWMVAALDILGLMGATVALLDRAAVTIGTVRLSLLLVAKGVLLIAILLWAALALARLVSGRLEHIASLSPSIQTLTRSLIKIALVFLALLIGLNAVGIDLTAFTVLSGAIGVGLGFGLQKIVSNFVSGIILLAERSIKPGDIIEVGGTHGFVTSLGGRYTTLRARDGKEYLIPNETLITNQVVNWSYTSPFVRLDLSFGVAYGTDLRLARRLAIEAAKETGRVQSSPEPVCHVTEFGDNGINLLLRFWIADPASGVINIKGDVFLALWDRLVAHGIEVPFPQRDVRVRDLPPGVVQQPVENRSAAD